LGKKVYGKAGARFTNHSADPFSFEPIFCIYKGKIEYPLFKLFAHIFPYFSMPALKRRFPRTKSWRSIMKNFQKRRFGKE